MSKQKQLVKNTFIILLGKICTQFLSFLLLPLYTAVLSTDDFGIVDLVTTYIGLLAPLITLQIEMALFRFLVDVRKNNQQQKSIITNTLVTVSILTITILIIYLLICLLIDFKYKFYLAIMVVSSICSSIILQLSRGLGDNVGYTFGSIIAGSMTIVCNVVFLLIFNLGITGMFSSHIISNLLCFIFLAIRLNLKKYIDFSELNKKIIKELLEYSLPLVPNGLIWWIINASDRTILSIAIGSSANGIYAVSNKFSAIFINIYNIFNISWTESVSLYIDDDQDHFLENTFNQTFFLFSSICLGIICCMPFVFKILVNPVYDDAYNYIPILLLGTLFNIIVSMLGAIYVARKKTIQITKTSLYSGIINIVINILLVKYIGIYAAAISTLLAFFIMAIYRYFDVQKYIKIRLNMKKTFIISILFLISILFYYYNNFFWNIINLLLMIGIIIILNKKIIVAFYNAIILKIKKRLK